MHRSTIVQCVFIICMLAHQLNGQPNHIPTSGAVGIGTADPRSKLDVLGVIHGEGLAESIGLWNVALSASVSITGGTLHEGGPTARTGNSLWTASSPNQSLQLDLGDAPYISIAAIAFGTHWRLDSRFVPKGYQIDVSTDGSLWTTYGSSSDNNKLGVFHSGGGYYRYVRITITAFQDGMPIANIAGLKVLTDSRGASSGSELWGMNINNNAMFAALSGGNVGIGTASPTHKLAVNGTIRAKEVIVDTDWADYVFSDGYRLAPLSEVEAHIREKRHLPGLPSAAQVAERGVSLGEMQTLLLAKLEELTLHVINIEKDNRSLRREVERLGQLR